jgi:hypothetical protein
VATVGEVLLPLLAGAASAASPNAAAGIRGALDTYFGQQELARRQQEEDAKNARRRTVGAFLAGLPEDPSDPLTTAAGGIARAGDVDTAAELYARGAGMKANLAAKKGEENAYNAKLATAADVLTSPKVDSAPEAGTAGPPAPEVVDQRKRQAMTKALFNLGEPRVAVDFALGRGTKAPAGHLQHVETVGPEGEGIYTYDPETGTLGKRLGGIPRAPKELAEAKAPPHLTMEGPQGYGHYGWNAQTGQFDNFLGAAHETERDPLTQAAQAAGVADRLQKDLDRSLRDDQAAWAAAQPRGGVLGVLGRPDPADAPNDGAWKSPKTRMLEQQLAGVQAAGGQAAARLSGAAGAPPAAGPPAALVRHAEEMMKSPPAAPTSKPRTFDELKAQRKR